MSDDTAIEEDEIELPPSTVPSTCRVQVRRFEDGELAEMFGTLIGHYIHAFGRMLELGTLDGVTVAPGAAYAEAARTLDRGHGDLPPYTPSDGHAVGIAMTVPVIRDGAVKSHIVLNADYLIGLINGDTGLSDLALHTMGHECCHVDATAKFERAFPGRLLGKHKSMSSWLAWHVATMVWDEYIVTRTCARWGADQTEGYEDTFLSALAEARPKVNDAIRVHLAGGPPFPMIQVANTEYAHLMKFSAYHLGNLDGFKIAPADRPRTAQALDGHWFEPYFKRLHEALRGIAKDNGRWGSDAPFIALADLHQDLVRLGGIAYYELPGRRYNFLWPPYVPADAPVDDD
ncbi:hypothetical protein ACG04R_23935 [Roseateles sp. BYS78W]|uniref:Uncharacterized protein n=1 Tax=Pelomonas candidula TaxID=3299025 RepID=A0ABW7HIK1_9BURK